jgi:putative transposase
MPNFHRFYIPNAIVFITCVTHDRVPILKETENVDLFLQTTKAVQAIHPFRLLAYAILPDHFHWLMRTEGREADFSVVLHSVKQPRL